MSIIKLKNGKYTVDIVNEFGKRVQRTFKLKNQAQAFEAEIKKRKYDTKLVNNNLLRARVFMLNSISEYEITKQNLKPASRKKYKAVMDVLKDFIRIKKIQYLDEFKPTHAEEFFYILSTEREIDRGTIRQTIKAKPKTVNFYLTTVRELFKREILRGNIERNPFNHVKNLKVVKPRPEYYTREEIKNFFTQTMKQEYHDAFKAFLLTGMRFEELACLRCVDVDLQNKIICVRNYDGFTTKTENAVREIPMSDELFMIIKDLALGKNENEFVFTSPSGSKLRERTMLGVCKRIANKAGITSRAFIHKFRHTFATMLVQADIPLETIKELLGHSSIVETEIYAHNKTNHRHHQVRILDQLFEN